MTKPPAPLPRPDHIHPLWVVVSALVVVGLVAVWMFTPPALGLRSALVTLAAMTGLVGIYPLTYLAYRGFSSSAQRERLRDDFRLLGLVQESELQVTVDKLYQTVYSPIQFVIYISLIIVVSLLVLLGYSQRASLGFIPAETMSLVFYAYLGAYVFSVQELVRRYNTFDLQPQVYSAIVVRMLVGVIITAVGAAVITLAGGELAGSGQPSGDPQAWAAVLAFVIGTFPSRGLRWFTQQANRVLSPTESASSELPLRNLLGLNAWHEARLAQMGIDDAQNLATVDIRRLLLTTQFDTQQIVHWIDQAIMYVKVGSRLERYRDAKLTTFHELREVLADLSLDPRLNLTAEAQATRTETRKRLAAALGMADPDELDRLADYTNYPNYVHLAEFYARTSQVARQRANLGMVLLLGALEQTDYERAVETGEQLLAQNRDDPDLHNRLGYAYYQISQRSADEPRKPQLIEQALHMYTEAIRLNPQLAQAYYNRSLVHIARSNFYEAVRDCSAAINMGDLDAHAFNNRGLAYMQLGYLDRALEDLHEALRLNDRMGAAYLNRAVACNAQSQFSQAAADFERAYLLAERKSELWIGWGIALIGLGRFDDAVDKLSQAVLFEDSATSAYSNRGYAYMQLGPDFYPQAERDLSTAVQRDAKLLDARINFGLLKSKLRKFGDAIEQYEKVLAAGKPQYELVTRYNLALAYHHNGQPDKAREQFEAIIKLAPSGSSEAQAAHRYLAQPGPASPVPASSLAAQPAPRTNGPAPVEQPAPAAPQG